MKKYQKILLSILAIISGIWFGITLILPDLFLRNLIETEISQVMNAKVTLGKMSINPLTLVITLSEVTMPHPEGYSLKHPLLEFEALELAPEFSPLLDLKSPLLIAKLIKPKVDISYLGNGGFSFDHLLPPKNDDPINLELPIFWISNFELQNGNLILRNAEGKPLYNITDINFDVPLSEASRSLQPTLTAKLDGTDLEVKGEIITLPTGLTTHFKLQTGQLPLEGVQQYIEASTPLKLDSGFFSLNLDLRISQPAQSRLEIALSGMINLQDLQLMNAAKQPLAKLKLGKFEVADFTLTKRQIVMREVELNGLFLQVTRLKSGSLDWEQWVTPQDINAPPEDSFTIEGARLSLRNTDFRLVNEASGSQGWIDITGLDGIIDNFSTKPKAISKLSLSFGISDEGVLILKGEGSAQPVNIDADLKINDLPLIFLRPMLYGTPLQDMLGRMDFNGQFKIKDDNVQMVNAAGAMRDFSFAREKAARTMSLKSTGNPAISLAGLQFKGLNLDLKTQDFIMDNLQVLKPYLRIKSDKDDYIPDVADWPKQGSAAANATEELAQAAMAKAATLGGWKFQIKDLQFKEGKLERMVQAKREAMITDLSLTAKPISSDLSKPITLTAKTKGVDSDVLELQGSVIPKPLQIRAKVKGTDLNLNTFSIITSAWTDLGLTGRALFDCDVNLQTLTPLKLESTGNLTLRDLTLSNIKNKSRLGSLRRLTLTNLNLNTTNETLVAKNLLVDLLRLNLAVDTKGDLNLLETILRSGAESTKTEPTKTPPKPNPWLENLILDQINIQNTAINFKDARTSPPTSLSIRELNINLDQITQKKLTPVKISAQLEGAPFTITGNVNFLQVPPQAKLNLKLNGLNLPAISGYSVKYLAYPIEQGKLNLKSTINTENDQFNSQNNLFIEKLTLGTKVATSKAPDYPLTLGLSLLTDRNGNIDINLPVTGKLDDLSLETGGIIGNAMTGLVGKVVTSPFSLVTGIFSMLTPNEPKVQSLAFNPGQTRIRPNFTDLIQELGKSIQQYPKVKLTLTGKYEPISDAPALARQLVYAQVTTAYLNSLPKNQQTTETRIPRADYEKWLIAAFKQAFPKQSPPHEPDIMEQQLAELTPIMSKDLQNLAYERALAVQEAILKIAPEAQPRITIAPFNLKTDIDLAQVEIKIAY